MNAICKQTADFDGWHSRWSAAIHSLFVVLGRLFGEMSCANISRISLNSGHSITMCDISSDFPIVHLLQIGMLLSEFIDGLTKP